MKLNNALSLGSSSRAMLGSTVPVNLTPNGDFATGDLTGFSNASGKWSVVNGQAVVTDMSTSSADVLVVETFEAVGGATYDVVYDIPQLSGGAISIFMGDTIGAARTSVGVGYAETLNVTTGGQVRFIRRFGNFTGALDNIDIRRIG